MTFFKKAFLGVGVCICLWLWVSSIYAFSSTATLSLEIRGLGIRHGTPKNIDFWVLPSASPSDQYLDGHFDSEFWIEDLLWSMTGHYTTIQCDGVHGSLWNTLTGVYLKAGNLSPTLLLWASGNVLISSSLQDYTSIIAPVVYIYKPTDVANAGLGNKYWDIPRLRILIPAGTPSGTYSGTIIFTLYKY